MTSTRSALSPGVLRNSGAEPGPDPPVGKRKKEKLHLSRGPLVGQAWDNRPGQAPSPGSQVHLPDEVIENEEAQAEVTQQQVEEPRFDLMSASFQNLGLSPTSCWLQSEVSHHVS
ncbi:uncharacterized protein LOC123636575 isoform X3 [Lemur catta]|uniref:uncharacterized protein LOC123636575 isoform X3 n=1 Tax=Lemur catta TaxID=9447 RepID=UPI001E26AB8B|nr:uncharacterized protein LOC123636575 isoform X3 [Lemur catta]